MEYKMLGKYYIVIEYDKGGHWQSRNFKCLKKSGEQNIIALQSGRITDTWSDDCEKIVNTMAKILQKICDKGNFYIEDWNVCFKPARIRGIYVMPVTYEMTVEEWEEAYQVEKGSLT